MKKILFLGVLLFGFATASAQAPLEEGKMQLDAGLGFSGYSAVPISAGLDYGVYPNVTVGGELTAFLNYNVFSIVGNGNYHFNEVLEIPSNFDVYAGASLGFVNYGGALFYGQIGGRYFFNNKLGLNLELKLGNYAYYGGKLGITYKF